MRHSNSVRSLTLLWAASLVLLNSCNPLVGTTAAGVCSNEGADSVNTYTIFGSWKKVDGYDTPRTQEELELDFETLIILPGSRMCKIEVKNGAAVRTIFKGDYTHDISRKALEVTYDDESADSIRYSYSGTCDETKMNFVYTGAKSEVYQVRSKDLEGLTCDPQQQVPRLLESTY